MEFICMITASYTLGILKSRNPWLVFRLKHEISKKKIVFSFMEKKFLIQFFSIWKK